ncbi:MAG: hypothetical protein J5979_06775 [Lachnospiraceae bacterium]|nr:hypothetical protein [Lachnospiraceae bacterium]
MAETKATEQIKVLAGTFPAAHGDQARKLAGKLKEAKIEGFAVKPAKEMPGYIQVIADCKDKAAAEDMIKQGAEKKIKLCMAK